MGNIKSPRLTTYIHLLVWRNPPRMDGNSTLVSNPRERCCVKEDRFAMSTYNDRQSESDHCIVYSAFPKPALRIHYPIAALLEHQHEQRPVFSRLQEYT